MPFWRKRKAPPVRRVEVEYNQQHVVQPARTHRVGRLEREFYWLDISTVHKTGMLTTFNGIPKIGTYSDDWFSNRFWTYWGSRASSPREFYVARHQNFINERGELTVVLTAFA